ncbi:nodulation protein NodH [Alkalilacustris brevis]|uniref:nodulation protein NodH n=1 Tax=Alkalilacustris brevis TaxID=2026338 RepID=UPI000E0D4C8F|nr:nodulation protein NodH [Alkalilacustris brevis]
MQRRFDYFVILAEMRTGSNFLEENINAYPGLRCHGELFNPVFVGHHNQSDFMGLTLEDRVADPLPFLAALRVQPQLSGFRFFHDHDPRVLDACLPDPRCAKIILTRNPLDSYVSLKIAKATGQWRLTNVTRQKTAAAEFDPVEFERHMHQLQEFQLRILHGLQVSGQTAFYIAYEDLHDIDVLNGLARFLGEEAQLDAPASKLKKQNPEPIEAKLANPEALSEGIARLDRFDLARTPNFEPRRGPGVPGFIAAAKAPLLFMPVPGGPREALLEWMAALDGVQADDLQQDFTRKTLGGWLRAQPGHRSFTVLRHPVARAHATFCDNILSGRFAGIRAGLRRNYGLSLPEPDQRAGYDTAARRADFLGFLRFLKGNLAGQSAMRVDASWASQGAVLRGFCEVLVPDLVLREESLDAALGPLSEALDRPAPPAVVADPQPGLAELYDDEVEQAAQAAYQRDYTEFGFGPWRG